MDVRAAVAVEAGKPLEIMTVQLDGPKAGEVLVEIKAVVARRRFRQCLRRLATKKVCRGTILSAP